MSFLDLKLGELDANTSYFESNFGSLSEEKANWKPNISEWSIGQIVDHIIIINSSYFPIFKEIEDGIYSPPFLSKVGFLARAMGKMILKGSQPEERKKVRTFAIWEPPTDSTYTDSSLNLSHHHDELKSRLETIRQEIERNIIIHSPANRNVCYPIQTALDIIIAHEKRHFQQILNNLNSMA